MAQDNLRAIVQRMVEAGESEDNIAAVIQRYNETRPQAETPKAEPKSIGGFLANIPASLGRLVRDTVVGGVDAAKFITEAAPFGGAPLSKKMERGQQVMGAIRNAPAIARAAGGALKDRYGSIENIGNTLYNDPAGVAADVSTVLTMGGSAATRAPRIAGQLRAAGNATNPLRLATKPAVAAMNAAGPRMQQTAVSAYERMLKPNKSTLEGMPEFGGNLKERSRAVAQALITDPNGQISNGGTRRFADATQQIQNKVNEIVDANPEARGSTQHLADAMRGGRSKFNKQWAPGDDTRAYDAVTNEVLNNPRVTKLKRTAIDTSAEHEIGLAPANTEVKVTGRALIPRVRAATARELTQGTYRSLGDKAYGELKGASTEGQKAAARGGRAILNEALPQVEPLNNAIARRIDLGQILDEAAFRSGKHDPIGLGQQVMLSGANPGLVFGALVNRPGIGSPVFRKVFEQGGKLSGAKEPIGAMQAALLARLMGLEQEP